MRSGPKRRMELAEWKNYERDMVILDFLVQGWRQGKIATEMGIATHEVARAVARFRKLKQLRVEDWREVEDEKLLMIWRKLYPLIDEGNLQAIDRGLKVIETRAKLKGMNVEKGGEVTNNVLVLPQGLSAEELAKIADMPLLEEGQGNGVSGGNEEAYEYTEGEVTVIDEGE